MIAATSPLGAALVLCALELEQVQTHLGRTSEGFASSIKTPRVIGLIFGKADARTSLPV